MFGKDKNKEREALTWFTIMIFFVRKQKEKKEKKGRKKVLDNKEQH